MRKYKTPLNEGNANEVDPRLCLVTDWEDIAYFYHRDHTNVFSCLSDAPAHRYEIFKHNPHVSCLMLFDQDVTDGIPEDAVTQARAMIWGTYTVDGRRKKGAFMDCVYANDGEDYQLFYEVADSMGWYRRGESTGDRWFNQEHVEIPVADPSGRLHGVSVILQRGPELLDTPLTYMDTLHLIQRDTFYIGVTDAKEYRAAMGLFYRSGKKL